MLYLPHNGYKIYKVAIYNRQVRDLALNHRRHNYFDERWADLQVRDVVARDEDEAMQLIVERFPPEDGFIIEGITPGQ